MNSVTFISLVTLLLVPASLAIAIAVLNRYPPLISVEDVLSYESMSTVINHEIVQQTYQKLTDLEEVSGLDIIRRLLESYEPRENIFATGCQLADVFSEYQVKDNSRPLNDEEKTFLANIVHAIWVETHVTTKSMPSPIVFLKHSKIWLPEWKLIQLLVALWEFIFPRLRDISVTWSLEGLAPETVEAYLLGQVHDSPRSRNDIKYYYHFKFYPLARNIIIRMGNVYDGRGEFEAIENNPETAVARFVEYAGDNFMHKYALDGRSWGWEEYSSRALHDGDGDKDLSESFQRRLTGCGVPSFVSILLARALNIPARVDHPECSDITDGHRYAFFPNIGPFVDGKPIGLWVHGDHIIDCFGGLGEEFFMRTDVIRGERADIIREEWKVTKRQNAWKAVDENFGLDFYLSKVWRSENQSRSLYASPWGSGFGRGRCGLIDLDKYPLVGRNYLKSRFGYFQLEIEGNKIYLRDQKYSLLDRIAAHWPLDGKWLEQEKIYEASLNGIHGRVIDPISVEKKVTEDGQPYLRFIGVYSGGMGIRVGDHPALGRNNEELGLSVWVLMPHPELGGTILERRGDRDGNLVYALEIDSDSKICFKYKVAGEHDPYIITSTQPIHPFKWHHVEVSFDALGKIILYLDSHEVGIESGMGKMPVGICRGVDPYEAYPASIYIAPNHFTGDMHSLFVLFTSLVVSEVISTATIYTIDPVWLFQGHSRDDAKIEGKGLSGARDVSFLPPAGITVENITSTEPTDPTDPTTVNFSITVDEDADMGPRSFYVINGDGELANSEANDIYFHVIAKPEITSIAPTTCPRGGESQYTIEGNGIGKPDNIEFDSAYIIIDDKNIKPISDEKVIAIIKVEPEAKLGPHYFSIPTPYGTAKSEDNNVFLEVTEKPEITGINPTSACQGGTNLTVHISGKGLAEANQVTFSNGIEVDELLSTSDELVSVEITVDENASVGWHSFDVYTPYGSVNSKDNNVYFFVQPKPEITSIEPICMFQGASRIAHIKGCGLAEVDQVTFSNGIEVDELLLTSDELVSVKITVDQNADIGWQSFEVNTPCGKVKSGDNNVYFSVRPKPEVASIEPTSTPRGKPCVATIRGSGLIMTDDVAFSPPDGIEKVEILRKEGDEVEIRFNVDDDADVGCRSFALSTRCGTISSAEYGVYFCIANAQPQPPRGSISSIHPSGGIAGIFAESCTISGRGLSNAARVYFEKSGIYATVLGSSDTEVRLLVSIAPEAKPGKRWIIIIFNDGTSINSERIFRVWPPSGPHPL